MPQQVFHCQLDFCNKRLIDFCFICKENSKYYCDEICAERDLEAKAERKSRFLWQ